MKTIYEMFNAVFRIILIIMSVIMLTKILVESYPVALSNEMILLVLILGLSMTSRQKG